MIAAAYVAATATLGLLASQYLPAGPRYCWRSVPRWRSSRPSAGWRRLADRWVFGDRLDGYEVLSRFGAMLEAAPGPADLLAELADAIRRGLGLQWARVRLDLALPGGSAADGRRGRDSAG